MTSEELERYVDKIVGHHDRLMISKFESIDNAIGLAREDVARRLAELNQLRSEVTQDRNQFVQQAIYESHSKDAATWRESVSDRLDRDKGADMGRSDGFIFHTG